MPTLIEVNMPRSACIVTKPLQLMIAMTIIEQLDIGRKADLLIVDAFGNAKMVFDNLNNHQLKKLYRAVYFFDNHKLAYQHANKTGYGNIYIDSDVGFKKYLTLLFLKIKNPFVKISVYEEGLGSYRTDIYSSNLKKFFLRVFGVGIHFGGSAITSSIYLFKTDAYINLFHSGARKVNLINKELSLFIEENKEFLYFLFKYEPIKNQADKTKECHIYLTSWIPDGKFIKKLKSFSGDKFIKPHPHLKISLERSGLIEVPGGVPAELVLDDLSKSYSKVIVYHHGTSAKRYLNSANLIFTEIKN